MEIFTSEKISEHVTRITEITGTHMYLVEGNEKALLIDTGCGIGNLKEYVEQLTGKPLLVVCTHGHMDHAGGADQFETVYLSQKDWKLSFTHCSLENRKQYTMITTGIVHPEINKEEIAELKFQKTRIRPYKKLLDEMKFDLGGVTVQALPLDGHTSGSMCMLFCEERNILFGDACNPSVFLFDTEAESVEAYKDALESFRKYEDRYDTVWLSHGPGTPVPKEILGQTIQVCDEILNDTDEKADFHFFLGGDYKMAHQILPDQMRKDGKLANIIYNPQKIFREEQK